MRAWRGGVSRAAGSIASIGLAALAAWALACWPGHATEPAPAGPPPPARPVAQASDPAAAAFAVLDRHCARCHQGGRLDIPAPAAAFGNILRLKEIAASPYLVQPGNPDGSRLYTSMLRRVMPPDVPADAPSAAPSAAEIAAVRAWITGLPPRPACPDRQAPRPRDVAAAIEVHVASVGDAASTLRFLSLAHLHADCAATDAMATYRVGVRQLLGSIGTRPEPAAVQSLDGLADTVLAVDLAALGWDAATWERIAQPGGDMAGIAASLSAATRARLGTSTPVVRADWLAAAVLKPPLYHELTGVPPTATALLAGLGADTDAVRATARKARIEPSRFGARPALVARLEAAGSTPLWSAWHATSDGKPDLFADAASKPGLDPPPHDVQRLRLRLPNGFPAFAVFGPSGARLDEVPPGVPRPHLVPRGGAIRTGLDCLACHGSGPAPRAGASDRPSPLAEWAAADAAKVAEAQSRAGVPPEASLHGVVPVVALAAEHERPVAAARLEAELGLERDTLAGIADRGGDRPAAVLARRLVLGLVARAEVEARWAELAAELGRGEAPLRPSAPAEPNGPTAEETVDPDAGITLVSEKVRYKVGDRLQLKVRTAVDCHLTLVSIDRRGRGTVIFPSDFQPDGKIAAGREVRVPAPDAGYFFRLNEPGRERIVALCNEASAATDGIVHDFERQRFTDLGPYDAHIAGKASTHPVAEAAAAPPPRPEPRRRGHRRQKPAPEPVIEAPRPEQISRTAIVVDVE
jgi:hypothetical protein